MKTHRYPKCVTFQIDVEPEEIPVRGNASAWGDEGDEKLARSIEARLERGDVWAWCCVTVTACVDGYEFTGRDNLGGCCYASEGAFKRDAYYRDMKASAYADLVRTMKARANPQPDAEAIEALKALGESDTESERESEHDAMTTRDGE